MKSKNVFLTNSIKVANSLAEKAVSGNVNSACCWIFHQPELPKEASKYKKVK